MVSSATEDRTSPAGSTAGEPDWHCMDCGANGQGSYTSHKCTAAIMRTTHDGNRFLWIAGDAEGNLERSFNADRYAFSTFAKQIDRHIGLYCHLYPDAVFRFECFNSEEADNVKRHMAEKHPGIRFMATYLFCSPAVISQDQQDIERR